METVEIKECLYYINHKKSLTLLDLKCGHKPESDHPYFGHQKNYKVLMKIDKISDVFTNPATFSRYTFFTLAPPSSILWTYKHWIMCQKLAEHLSFHNTVIFIWMKIQKRQTSFVQKYSSQVTHRSRSLPRSKRVMVCSYLAPSTANQCL